MLVKIKLIHVSNHFVGKFLYLMLVCWTGVILLVTCLVQRNVILSSHYSYLISAMIEEYHVTVNTLSGLWW